MPKYVVRQLPTLMARQSRKSIDLAGATNNAAAPKQKRVKNNIVKHGKNVCIVLINDLKEGNIKSPERGESSLKRLKTRYNNFHNRLHI